MAHDDSTRPFPWERSGEVVSFSTPEQIEVAYRVAPFATRFLAVLIDTAIIYAFLLVLILGGVVLGISVISEISRDGLGLLLATFLILQFMLQFLYFVWAEMRYDGQTLGKRWTRIRAVMVSGHGLTFGASVIRTFARIADHLPPIFLLPVVTKGHRRIGDLLGGTIVINESQEDADLVSVSEATSHRGLTDKHFYFSATAGTNLVTDDLNLIEHVFYRTQKISTNDGQLQVFGSVAEKYIERLALHEQAAEIKEDPRRFLEELYLFARDRLDAEQL